jgi:cysteine dioxygenase
MHVAVEGIVQTLRGVPPARFQPGEICTRLAGVFLDPRTLAPYLHFAPRRYTRNLIYRDEVFELLALCWEPHTESPIHNHSGQLCWLSIQRGALRLENFLSLDGPGPGANIRLVPHGGVDRAPEGVLDLQQGDNGIHRVSNPFDERAVSLHVYSRPYDTCLAYDPAARISREIRLHYHSVGGKLVEGRAEQLQ